MKTENDESMTNKLNSYEVHKTAMRHEEAMDVCLIIIRSAYTHTYADVYPTSIFNTCGLLE